MKVMRRAELDAAQCVVPGCDHKDHSVIFLNQRCHPKAGIEAEYLHGSRVLMIQCSICGLPVINVAVVKEVPLPEHPHLIGMEAKYIRGTGVLAIQCPVCEQSVIDLEVAA